MLEQKDNILAVWQPIGQSTYQITNSLAKKYNTKAAHTGVLDPLAQGVIIVLLGEERFNKIKYSKTFKKGYEFEVAFGLQTDSFDALGFLTQVSVPTKKFTKIEITNVLDSFIGEYNHQVPLYSAIKVKGKKLFYYPKENLEVPEIPTKKSYIYEIELLELRDSTFGEIASQALYNISQISHGEFRQKEISKMWIDLIGSKDDKQLIQVAKIKVETASGAYVRSLSQDICQKLHTIGMVGSLTRTYNGDYLQKDCIAWKAD